MRNTFRYGLASIIVAGTALGATIVACGDEGSGSSSSSSGNLPEASTTDSPSGDTGTDKPDAAPKPNFAKLTLVNATTDMGPNSALTLRGDAAIRVCFKQGTTQANLGVAPYPPLPDKAPAAGTPPGIFYGTGGTFPSFGLDLEGRIIVPIVMNASTLLRKGIVNPGTGQPGTTCDELVGETADAAAGLVENTDYWVLPAIDAGTFKKEKAYVLALTGCVGDATILNKDKCGANAPTGTAPGVGNLAVKVFETTTKPVSATQVGVQFLHASTAANALFGPGAGNLSLTPGFMSDLADAGSFKAAVPAPITVSTLSAVTGVTGVKDSDYFVLDKGQSPGTGAPFAPFPLPLIQRLSGLGAATAPTVYKDGANFVFIAVGDAQQPTFIGTDGGCTLPAPQCGDGGDGTSFNTQSFHFLAFPTDPTVVPYKP